MNNLFFIKIFGCQMNINESKKISELLIKNNFKKTENINKSNIIIINTCSVRENSNKKLYKYLYNLNKKKNFLFIISGCTSNFLAKFLLNKFNFINIIIGSQNLYILPYLIKNYYYYKCKQIKIDFLNSKKQNLHIKKNIIKDNFIVITEGCNKYCSYCVVPYTRGIEISYYLNLIFYKILILNKNNKFIFLIGQNVNSYYGKISNNSNKYIKFNILLNYISEIYFLKIINFITSHPNDFVENLINTFKLNNKISNFIHLPIQSCSNKILYLMRRNYKLINYKIILRKIKNIRLNIFFSTDIILCFYKENNCDFYKTLIFIEKFLFDKSYIFIYNPRPYTKSYYFVNNISNNLKKKRFEILKFKIKNNIKYINKLILKKIEFVFIKNYFLFNNNLFLTINNTNKIIYFYLNSNNFIIGKILKLKIINFNSGVFYGEILY